MASEGPRSQKKRDHNIKLDPSVGEGEYANLIMIAHSPEEFILDFIRVMPGVPVSRVRSRIIISPPHAKRLLRALGNNIARYEKVHGLVKDANEPTDQSIQFGSAVGEA